MSASEEADKPLLNRRVFAQSLCAAAAIAAGSTLTMQPILSRELVRVSTVDGDPGAQLFKQWQADGFAADVYLEGVKQDAVTADEANGFVDVWLRKADGKYRKDAARFHLDPATGEPVVERRYGTVEVKKVPKSW